MLDVQKSPELQAAIFALKSVRADVRRDINKEARSKLGGLWVPALQRRAATSLEQRIILPGAKARAGGEGFSMVAASSSRKLRGGLVPAQDYAGAEFGATPKTATFQRRSRRGRVHQVTATVNRQFRGRSKNGRIAFDAASELGTKLVASWVVALVTILKKAAGE